MLAGRRSSDDPLAAAAGAPHRALLDIEGEPMLVRVVERLLGWPSIERVLINIDTPELVGAEAAFTTRLASGEIELLTSTDSPSRSVLESLDAVGLEAGTILVTTADHALLDDEILEAFFRTSEEQESDLSFALVPRESIEARFPEARRTYLRFRDGDFSGANLFLFRTPESRRAALFWRRVESQRKHPWQIARAFGLMNLLLFATRQLELDSALARASKVIDAQVTAIRIGIAEAAVDVDKIEDLELVRRVLAERHGS